MVLKLGIYGAAAAQLVAAVFDAVEGDHSTHPHFIGILDDNQAMVKFVMTKSLPSKYRNIKGKKWFVRLLIS